MQDNRARSKRSLRRFFEEQIRILDFKQSWWQRYKQHRKRKVSVERSLELLVSQTNSRIRIVANYRKKLRKSAAVLDQYITTLTDKIIEQMTYNLNDYKSESFLQALFFEEKLCQRFFDAQHQQYDACILVASPYYKDVLMPALEGDKVIQDARKNVLTFKHKRVVLSVTQQAERSALLRAKLNEFLMEKFISQIKQEIEPHMASGYGALKDQQHLSQYLTPKAYLKSIIKLMKHPEQLFFMSELEVITDKFGMIDTQLRDMTYRQFDYVACHFKHEPTLSICVVNMPSKEC
ncbi:hypothetical protein LP316_09690 [Thalassotalea sp. LPB0316]|uniref:hypothetical protein n=1 Tax=Thalassotalea sp. LPB0316 TaxID=2769490 RepID=UPI001868C11C|nr:hypothetical protein [Thalassotalea sp. LPB0316]QOL24617.1 hypothetical protein LP316_09690 [Thalassotalea sp. LPB0316]